MVSFADVIKGVIDTAIATAILGALAALGRAVLAIWKVKARSPTPRAVASTTKSEIAWGRLVLLALPLAAIGLPICYFSACIFATLLWRGVEGWQFILGTQIFFWPLAGVFLWLPVGIIFKKSTFKDAFAYFCRAFPIISASVLIVILIFAGCLFLLSVLHYNPLPHDLQIFLTALLFLAPLTTALLAPTIYKEDRESFHLR